MWTHRINSVLLFFFDIRIFHITRLMFATTRNPLLIKFVFLYNRNIGVDVCDKYTLHLMTFTTEIGVRFITIYITSSGQSPPKLVFDSLFCTSIVSLNVHIRQENSQDRGEATSWRYGNKYANPGLIYIFWEILLFQKPKLLRPSSSDGSAFA